MSWRGLPPWSDKEANARLAADWPDPSAAREAAASPIDPGRLAAFHAALDDAKAAAAAGKLRVSHEAQLALLVADDGCAKPAAALARCIVDNGAFCPTAKETVAWAGGLSGPTGAPAPNAATGSQAPAQGSMRPRASQRYVRGVNVDLAGVKCAKALTNYGHCLGARLARFQAALGVEAASAVVVPSLREANSVALVAPFALDLEAS